MTTRDWQQPSRSIRTKLLILLLGIAGITILLLSFTAVNTVENLGSYAVKVSSDSLNAQAKSYMELLVQRSAREYNQVLSQVLKETEYISGYVASVYSQDSQLGKQPLWKAEDHMTQGANGQFSNSTADITSVFVPNFKKLDPQTKHDIELGTYLDLTFPPVMKSNPDIVAVYFATPSEVTRYYPNIDLGSALPPDFRVTQRVWYLSSISPKNLGNPIWSVPYIDATGKGVVTTASRAVLDPAGKVLGVVGVDITLNNMKASVESMKILKTGYAFLVDKDGLAIALPEQGYRDFLNRLPRVDEAITQLTEVPKISPILDQMMQGKPGFTRVTLGSRDLFIAYAPLESTGWSLGTIIEADEVMGVVSQLQENLAGTTRRMIFQRILPVSLLILAGIIVGGSWLISRLVVPIQGLTVAMQGISEGNWDIPFESSSNDELGLLSQQFKDMKEKLYESFSSLQKEVVERTRVLEHKNMRLQAAAHVMRESGKIRDLQQLLDHTAGLIGAQFGFNQVSIYLVDSNNEYATLQTFYGPEGYQLEEREVHIKVNQDSIVGYVANTGTVYISDAQADMFQRPELLLSRTRFELALPLRGSQQMIGVLDIRSQEEADFSPENVAILQSLADQLTIAIENARIYLSFLETLKKSSYPERLSPQNDWAMSMLGKGFRGYQYDMSGLNPIPSTEDENSFALEDGQPVRVPLKVRGEIVANLEVWPEGDKIPLKQVDLLNELSDRLGQAIESARLYEDSQSRAGREQVLNQFISTLSKSLDLDSMLREAVRELGQMPGVKEASIFIHPATASSDENQDSISQGGE